MSKINIITITFICTNFFVFIANNHYFSQITNPQSINIISNPKSNFTAQPSPVVIPMIPRQPESSWVSGFMGMKTADEVIARVNVQYNMQMGVPATTGAKSHEQQQMQLKELQKILDEQKKAEEEEKYNTYLANSKAYQMVFNEIMKMNSGEIPFSLKKAVFMVENVYIGGQLNYAEYEKLIQKKVETVRWLMKKKGILENDHIGKHQLIQSLYSEKIILPDKSVQQPFLYDFEDYRAEKDWTKMFVYKLLKTGKGQCHSLPLLYLILAEELNVNAWLSLAPEHSFIKFGNAQRKNIKNYETTNGCIVTEDWLMESGYIKSEALKNKIYLDTLNKQGLISTLIADMVMGYNTKIGYDEFSMNMSNTVASIYPQNIQGHLLTADRLTLRSKNLFYKYGNPPFANISKYPELETQYKVLMDYYQKIDDLGYVKMPPEMYEHWLARLNEEKNKTK